MTTNTIRAKIQVIGAFFVILMLSIVGTTIYLNAKNKKDALIINVAGKERMLTQRISKNIFYLYHNNSKDTTELDSATEEFIYSLNSLKDGNTLTGIPKAPTDKIAAQISKIEILWNNFYNNIQRFKELLIVRDKNENELIIKSTVNSVYNTNNNLLQEVDNLVTMYTNHSENKTEYIKYFQYGFGFMIIILILYSLSQLKTMEKNAKKFFDYSQQLIQSDVDHLKPIQIEAETEIVQATDTLNCFIDKVNSAMDYSAEAIEHSKNASLKLEEITDEFDKVIDDLNNSTDISRQLNKSEDMVIQSTEDLINSTQKLQELKAELDKLILSCKSS
ncbi:type IV pili methyl-accepting chemotaxis transducer N-terminal domain-containing protein [Arcobacter sp. LA11]|uniref:type IV pili methyl-accepting chemotaxis transducer N-terminal domain-containing protein n=1 Tax=Arcobacter sp. LA11 TaxID=1898176 RepID=UPI0009337819|nr:type IV pili methyl-accepting chemotaxis transducer N-terminal domain-containing protein [Arcobacter sp. LA11]